MLLIVMTVFAAIVSCGKKEQVENQEPKTVSIAMKSENFEVSQNMMTYYFVNTYSNFLDIYGDYASMLSLGSASVPFTELRDIQFGGTEENPNSNDRLFFGAFEGTWFDYFMTQTYDSVKTMLIYCEEAKARGLELNAEEKQAVNETADNILRDYKMQYYGTEDIPDSYITEGMYGKGITKSDMADAIALSELSEKCKDTIRAEIEAEATDDKITEIYNNSKKQYDVVSYYTYTLSTSFEKVAREILGTSEVTTVEEYEAVARGFLEKTEALKGIAARLESAKDINEFKEILYLHIADEAFDSLYAAQNIGEGIAPDESDLAIIRENLINAAVAEALSDASSAKDDAIKVGENMTLYGVDVSGEFASAMKNVKNELFDKARNTDKTSLMIDARDDGYDTFYSWAFEDGRKSGDIKLYVEGGQYTESDIADHNIKRADMFRARAYFVIEPVHRNDTPSRDVAYMIFTSKTSAESAIAKLENIGSGITKDTFVNVATEMGAMNDLMESYTRGELFNDAFDAWVFGEDIKIGDYNKTPIMTSDGSYMVALYAANGDPSWQVVVRDEVIQASYDAYLDGIMVKYSASITVDTDVIAKIGVE